ncbi:family 10 glycosylhydrolase [Paenibacillus sp. YPG26]|uniref:family 10 glycosylhydrolase n=1 Tax=Paenibacillus sp. YPG26 TaxID=2878915 RepID=UPI00203F554F|nr:family 10 glycosylhydrolase [Paenibacillus sp. YPG26]USB34662.1 family 10 glycosylhydrolase [Paenibacillus sp. YPG26]
MKLRSLLMLMLLSVLSLSSLSPSAQAKASQITMLLDGQPLRSDVPPYLKSNFTMVPLRVISEGLGASVNWNPSTSTATISKGLDTLVLQSGKRSAKVNGAAVSLDATVQVVSGRTMVPLRFVGEHLGLLVNWNQAKQQVVLTTKDAGGVPTVPVTPPGTTPGNTDSAQLRGAWISTVYNLDWPSTKSYGREDQQKAEYTALLDKLQDTGINAVFVQVRPAADAIYPSKLVPWSQYLTGTPGKDPGYDPLAFLVEETHRRGMKFHAWFNPFRASILTDVSKLPANSTAVQHPDRIVKQGGKLYINPGIPEARQQIIDSIMEVVQNYNIDGVHLDDYFYPSAESTSDKFDDDSTYKTYNPAQIKTKGDWRRANINGFVRDLGQSIHKVKPAVSFGISPFGVWRNKATDLTGSDTKAGITAYDSMYADVRTWIRSEWIDYVAPQVYWSMSFTNARYDKLVDWWSQEVRGTDVQLYIGHAPYKLGSPEVGWQTAQEIINQLNYNKQSGEVKGSIFYSAKDLIKNPLGLLPLLKSYFLTN